MSKSPSLRRIQADIRELSIDPSDRYHAHPLENDMFEWHFTIRGAEGTDFEGGYYHGRILLPADYPFKPPNIVFLTPNGRFETNVKVCLSFSAYHPELWQPAWGIRLILEALISFLPTKGDGAIGALDWTSAERKKLAKKSCEYNCKVCGNVAANMKAIEARVQKKRERNKNKNGGIDNGGGKSKFQKEIEQLHAMQLINEAGNDTNTDNAETKSTKDEAETEMTTEEKNENDDKEEGEKEVKKASDEKVSEDSKSEIVAEIGGNVDGDGEKKSLESADSSGDASHDPDANEVYNEADAQPEQQQQEQDEAEVSAKVDDTACNNIADDKTNENVCNQKEVEKLDKKNQLDSGIHSVDASNKEGTKPDVKTGDAQAKEAQTQSQEQQEAVQEQPTPETVAIEPEPAVVAEQRTLDSPLLSDPVVHTGIVIFGIIVCLLVQKIRAIVEDMRELEALFQQN